MDQEVHCKCVYIHATCICTCSYAIEGPTSLDHFEPACADDRQNVAALSAPIYIESWMLVGCTCQSVSSAVLVNIDVLYTLMSF